VRVVQNLAKAFTKERKIRRSARSHRYDGDHRNLHHRSLRNLQDKFPFRPLLKRGRSDEKRACLVYFSLLRTLPPTHTHLQAPLHQRTNFYSNIFLDSKSSGLINVPPSTATIDLAIPPIYFPAWKFIHQVAASIIGEPMKSTESNSIRLFHG
jgi:hypothetical protein